LPQARQSSPVFSVRAWPQDRSVLLTNTVTGTTSSTITVGPVFPPGSFDITGINGPITNTDPLGESFVFTLDFAAGSDAQIFIGTTPVPAALPLFATGLGGLGLLGWRRKRKAKIGG
jgi:hypothetical protein